MNPDSDGLELSLRIRQIDLANSQAVSNANNNFVRLSPQTAQCLFDIALAQFWNHSDSLGQIDADCRCSGWSIDKEARGSQRCTSGIEFLPLSITFENGETIYTSYNGGDLDMYNMISGSTFDYGTFSFLNGVVGRTLCVLLSFLKILATRFFETPLREVPKFY
jgi:hypothetical protein